MTNIIKNALLPALAGVFIAGCGPTFDPASRIETTRVIGARIEVEGAPDRASPLPGETADVTWLVTSPAVVPGLGWAFVVCATGVEASACLAAPRARFDGTAVPPRIAVPVPSLADIAGAASITLYGAICAGGGSMPLFDPQNGLATCTDGGAGTTVSLDLAVQQGDDANHNPTADRAFTLDNAAWAASSEDPCAQGPRVAAGSRGHVIGEVADGSDREPYSALMGDPPVATAARESLQLSRFTTAGKLKSQFSFIEAADDSAATTADVAWDAPTAAEVAAAGTPVIFTFVVRDDRGGTAWTTRQLCVVP